MNKKELVKTMQAEFDNGETLSNIYLKYKSNDPSEIKIATLVATLKDQSLIKKHRVANRVLISVVTLLTILTALIGYASGLAAGSSNPVYWCAIAIVPFLFLYNFVKVNHRFYLLYLILSVIQIPNAFSNFGANPTADVVGVGFAVGMIALVLYLKKKLFPYMGLVSATKDSNGQYLFLHQRESFLS